MRIGVISDTHGDMATARLAVGEMGEIKLLLHAGDLYQDACSLAEEMDISVEGVVGNCDWVNQPAEVLFTVAKKRIWLTHGHKYRVKKGLSGLLIKAKEKKADIVVFGHTHIALNEYMDGILFFNPGSISQPRNSMVGTYGIIEIENGQIYSDILEG